MRTRHARTRWLSGAALCFLAAAPAAAHGPMKFRNAKVEPVTFAALNGWADDDQAAAFGAFLKSCKAILNGTAAMRKARPIYGALYEVCHRAVAAGTLDRVQARTFFEKNFKPVRISPLNDPQGFLTGYYETEFEASRYPSDEFKFPIYRVPQKLVGHSKVFANLNRGEIEDGAIAGRDLEICYVKDPIDAFFAQIQGSARVKLDSGNLLRLNYIASNGQPYTPVGKFLIDKGIISKEEMSMDKIRDWMEANPDEGKELRRKNRSFVFFQETALGAHDECIGAQGVPLTPERSLAVDKSLHVYGTPFWIEAELPIKSETPDTPFHRLMVAQDTGSAIVGPARADIYFGHGEEISHIAGRIKQHGNFYMMVPQTLAVEGNEKVPLPKARPAGVVASNTAAAPEEVTGPVPHPKPRPTARPKS
jgi:membrane-bound lytic murein transglycosylase A